MTTADPTPSTPVDLAGALLATIDGYLDPGLRKAPRSLMIQLHPFAVDGETPNLEDDPVFGVKPSLVRTFERRAADDPETLAGGQSLGGSS